jgi:hypothetical protein
MSTAMLVSLIGGIPVLIIGSLYFFLKSAALKKKPIISRLFP